MRTEHDIREALASLEREAPDARDVPALNNEFGSRRSTRRSRRLMPAVAAACVAVIAASAITVLPRLSDSDAPVTGPVGASRSPSRDDLLVRDGDRVHAAGLMIAEPGKPVIYCAAPAALTPADAPPRCDQKASVTVTGLDLARLSGSRTVRGVTFGHATIRGIWHDWTIDVQEQVAGIQSTTVPCAEPPGGWKRAPRGTAAREGKPIFDLVERYRERMAHAVIALPHDPIDPRLPGDVAEVFVITLPNAVVDSARKDLGRLYDGNLCIIPIWVPPTPAATPLDPEGVARANEVARELLRRQGAGTMSTLASADGPAAPNILVLDEQTLAEIAPIDPKYLQVNPAIRPVR